MQIVQTVRTNRFYFFFYRDAWARTTDFKWKTFTNDNENWRITTHSVRSVCKPSSQLSVSFVLKCSALKIVSNLNTIESKTEYWWLFYKKIWHFSHELEIPSWKIWKEFTTVWWKAILADAVLDNLCSVISSTIEWAQYSLNWYKKKLYNSPI